MQLKLKILGSFLSSKVFPCPSFQVKSSRTEWESAFVPVPIAGGDSNRKVLFSIWETRVSDYALFIEGAGRDWPE